MNMDFDERLRQFIVEQCAIADATDASPEMKSIMQSELLKHDAGDHAKVRRFFGYWRTIQLLALSGSERSMYQAVLSAWLEDKELLALHIQYTLMRWKSVSGTMKSTTLECRLRAIADGTLDWQR